MLAFIAVFAVAVAIYYPFSPGGRQAINMRAAESHAAALRPRLAADPRFARVRLEPYTARNGSLLVAGTVATPADQTALDSIVEASRPPVSITYAVTVGVDAPTRPAGH